MDELREQIAEIGLHYLTLCKRRDDYSPTMVEPELTDQIMKVIYPPYDIKPQGEPPILSDEEIMSGLCEACEYIFEGCIEKGKQSTCIYYKDTLKARAKIAKAQRDSDIKYKGELSA